MARQLSVKIEARAEVTWVALSGDISESSNFAPVLETRSQVLLFDLSGIERVNSVGVREWVRFLDALLERGSRFEFERCSVAVVAQMNMISRFMRGGLVRSVLAPFFCGACSTQLARQIELTADALAAIERPVSCPGCGSPMELDDLPDAYLAFNAPQQ